MLSNSFVVYRLRNRDHVCTSGCLFMRIGMDSGLLSLGFIHIMLEFQKGDVTKSIFSSIFITLMLECGTMPYRFGYILFIFI